MIHLSQFLILSLGIGMLAACGSIHGDRNNVPTGKSCEVHNVGLRKVRGWAVSLRKGGLRSQPTTEFYCPDCQSEHGQAFAEFNRLPGNEKNRRWAKDTEGRSL